MDSKRKQYERQKVPCYPIMFNTPTYVIECRLSEMCSSTEVKNKHQGLCNTYFSTQCSITFGGMESLRKIEVLSLWLDILKLSFVKPHKMI